MEITQLTTTSCHANIDTSSRAHLLPLPSLNYHMDHPTPPACQCISTLKGHSSYVSELRVLGHSLYSGSVDRHIRIWPAIPSELSDTMYSYAVIDCKSAVKSLAISGGYLFSCHQDRKIRVWDIDRQRRPVSTLPIPRDRFLSLFLPSKYTKVRRHKTCTWVHHADVISGLAVSTDGSLLYSVSWDRTLKIWRTSDFRCIESVARAHDDAINAIVVSNGGFIYTGSADTTVKVWKNHSLVATLQRHDAAVNALALSSDGTVLYSGACDRSIVVWEGGGGRMEATGVIRGHAGAVLCLSTIADLVCSGSADNTVRVWRRGVVDKKGGYSSLAVLVGHTGAIKSLALLRVEHCGNNTTYLVYSGGMDCDIKVWKLVVPKQFEI